MSYVYRDDAYRMFFNLPTGEQRKVREAVRVLVRAGMSQDNALVAVFQARVDRADNKVAA